MRTFKVPVLLLLILIIAGCKQNSNEKLKNELKSELSTVTAGFMQSLKKTLMSEIQENGFASAVSVCSDTALKLTKDFGEKNGVEIRRVSFKNRNPLNYPDDYESRILKEFEKLIAERELDKHIERIEIFEEKGKNYVRYMKPIFIEAPCLNCHGDKELINKDVLKIINEKYPDDKATGYKLNELRGAVSIKKVLN